MAHDPLASLLESIRAAGMSGHAPGAMAEYCVRISGSPALPFHGQLKVTAPDGSQSERPLQGQIPWELSLSGCNVQLALQCQGAQGTLRVEIFKAGRLVSTSTLSGQGGSIMATA
jgi:hypothetical protein